MTAEQALWIRRYHSDGDFGNPAQLVCFPHAGGSASFFFPISAALTPDLAVRAVQYPGRQDRRGEPPFASIGAMADAVADAARPLFDQPVAFFGHSMGAVLAYEVALRLEAAGYPPLVRFFASGRRAPSRDRPSEVLHNRDDRTLIAELRLLSGTDGDMLRDPEMLEMILPALRADFQALDGYRHDPEQRLTCPITAMIGDVDPRVNREEADAWADHTTGDFQTLVLPGGHFYLVERARDVIRAVADELSAPAAVPTSST